MTRVQQEVFRVELPLPPSVNAAFMSGRAGSKFLAKSAAYIFWLGQVEDVYGRAKSPVLPIAAPGRLFVRVDLPESMRGDVDNRIKLVLDVLRPTRETDQGKRYYGLGVIQDDALVDWVLIGRGRHADRQAHVTVAVLRPDETIADAIKRVELHVYLDA